MYNKYVVTKDLPMQKGIIKGWFDQPGGGRQYMIEPDFVDYIYTIKGADEPLIDALVRLGYLGVIN